MPLACIDDAPVSAAVAAASRFGAALPLLPPVVGSSEDRDDRGWPSWGAAGRGAVAAFGPEHAAQRGGHFAASACLRYDTDVARRRRGTVELLNQRFLPAPTVQHPRCVR